LHRARDRYADMLLIEIAHTVVEPTDAAIEDELAELGCSNNAAPPSSVGSVGSARYELVMMRFALIA